MDADYLAVKLKTPHYRIRAISEKAADLIAGDFFILGDGFIEQFTEDMKELGLKVQVNDNPASLRR